MPPSTLSITYANVLRRARQERAKDDRLCEEIAEAIARLKRLEADNG